MLDVTTYNETTTSWQSAPRRQVILTITSLTAKNIGMAQRSPYDRALLAASWLAGRLIIEPPTAALAAKIFGVSQATVHRAAADLNAAPASTDDLLVHHWLNASPIERARFGLEIGCGEIWDAAIVPNT
jgi:hypothetical protein